MDKHNAKSTDASLPVTNENRNSPLTHKEVTDILTFRVKGLSIREIATLVSRSPASVERVISRNKQLLEAVENAEKYRGARGQLLTAAEGQLLRSMTEGTAIEKATLNQLAYSFTQVLNARRLEEDKSTSNTSVQVKFQHVELPRPKND